MKAIGINGSPRKEWNTAKLINSALDGAKAAGAETELVNLYDLDYTGCRSCFACKLKSAEPCRCYWNDDLSPVIDRVLSSNVLFIGSPIYMGNLNAQTHAFLERLGFLLTSYDSYRIRLFKGKINTAIFYTMNVDEGYYNKALAPILKEQTAMLSHLGGKVNVYPSFDTLQFEDYSKYSAAMLDEKSKKKGNEERFPKELQRAYDVGYNSIINFK